MRALLPRFCLIALILAGSCRGAGEELPTREPGEAVDGVPGLMLDDLPNLEPLPDTPLGPVVNVERARADLQRARSKQQRWQKLARQGILSQVEAEGTALEVAGALVKYQAALAAVAEAQVAQLRAKRERGDVAADELAAAEAVQRTSAALAADAVADLKRRQLQQAEAHLDRQRRLHAVGVVPRSQIQRAQAAVNKLRID